MKTKLTILVCLVGFLGMAQNGINYKALIKDTSGNVVANQGIDMVFNIQHESISIYSELQKVMTDNNGIAIVTIGDGTPTIGSFDTIDWKLRNLELNIQIDFGDGLVDLGNSPFNAVPYAINTLKPQGLEAIDEGNGIGWRLTNRDPLNHGDIGEHAVDFSTQIFNGDIRGATGTSAVAFGIGTEASGRYSCAMGQDSKAIGSNSFAFGLLNEANGNISTSIGFRTSADAYNSFAIGRYNVGGGNLTSWVNTNPLFEIGNGTSDSNRNNALTVYKSGRHEINSNSIGLNISAESTGIIVVAKSNGITVNADEYGGSFNGQNAGIIASSSIFTNPDIILRGNGTANANDDGIISSDPELSGSDIYLRSNDAVVIELDNDNNGNGNFFIQDSDGDDVFSVSETGNVNIDGDVTGLRVRSSISSNPDIVLRGNGSGNSQDDGIISSDPLYSGSDLYFRSNDAVVIELDDDDNGSGSLIVRNGDDLNVFTIDEYGSIEMMGNELRMTHGTILDYAGEFVFDGGLFPDLDNEYRLGTLGHRWESVFSTNGTIQTSDRRSKTNIANLEYGLAEVLQMQPVSFNWKNKNNPDTKLGLIAQDLQTLIPEVVISHSWEKDESSGTLTKKEIDRFGVYYSDLIPVLINAIKEQNKIIESQGEALKASKNNYEALLSRIETLESNTSN